MKRASLIAIPILTGLIVGTTAAAVLYVRQAAQPPNWYEQQSTEATADLNPDAVRSRVLRRMTVTDNNEVETTIQGEELAVLVEEAIASHPGYGQWLEKTRDFQTTIEDGRFKTGVMVNLDEVKEYLGDQEREWLEQATALIPGLEDRSIYIGLEGRPRVEDGQLWLDRDTLITIGNMRLSPDVIARQFGLDPAVLNEGIRLNLNVDGVDINTINLDGDRAIVRGVFQQS